MATDDAPSYWQTNWRKFKRHQLGYFALFVVLAFCLIGIYAPLLASSKPLFLTYEGVPYFPLFRYLYYSGFFSKNLDLFFNLLIFIFPLMVFCSCYRPLRHRGYYFLALGILQLLAFLFIIYRPLQDPEYDAKLSKERIQSLKGSSTLSGDWPFELQHLSPYAKINQLVQFRERNAQQERLHKYLFSDKSEELKTSETSFYSEQQQQWLKEQSLNLKHILMPPFSHFHWEDDTEGDPSLNQELPWWMQTRTNRKNLLSALIFGVRISLVVGFLAVAIALAIGLPIGAIAGFYGGLTDIVICRLLEIWEGMPTFFMLLMAVAILQSKSIFIVIAIIGFFGWTGFSRYLRGEFFKQRSLPYVEAGESIGFSNPYLMFVHILPNAIPPVLTLLPFAIMGAISSEAGLSFLGLGEESSCSWGVLMDEGRSAFPGESSLLWPPAILLTLLLIAIALVGDALRDTLDPKMD